MSDETTSVESLSYGYRWSPEIAELFTSLDPLLSELAHIYSDGAPLNETVELVSQIEALLKMILKKALWEEDHEVGEIACNLYDWKESFGLNQSGLFALVNVAMDELIAEVKALHGDESKKTPLSDEDWVALEQCIDGYDEKVQTGIVEVADPFVKQGKDATSSTVRRRLVQLESSSSSDYPLVLHDVLFMQAAELSDLRERYKQAGQLVLDGDTATAVKTVLGS